MATHHHDQEDIPDPLRSLLSNPSRTNKTATIVYVVHLVVTCIALATASAFGFLYFSSSSVDQALTTARPLTKLKHPVVIMISSDGFRFGYQHKTKTPNLARLISEGTEAATGLIPVFPSLTFPNHYAIATGLYPAYHGIINNVFYDPALNQTFSKSSVDPVWWLGEPLWVTAANEGKQAATYFWPGSQVHKGKWDCPAEFCMQYNKSVPFEDRVDRILSYFDGDEVPHFMTIYLEYPDYWGHKVGPDHPNVTAAVSYVDRMIGRLIKGLKKRHVYEDVNILMLGDHGMVGICSKKVIVLEDLAPWISIPESWIESDYPVISIRPTSEYEPSYVVAKMNEALQSGKVDNGQYLKVYLKEDLPSSYHYVDNDRIPPVIAVADEGYAVQLTSGELKGDCGGAHGYDNELFSMRTIFIGRGPRFAKGRKVPSFQNIEIYNLVADILGLKGAPNNGTLLFPKSVLLPHE